MSVDWRTDLEARVWPVQLDKNGLKSGEIFNLKRFQAGIADAIDCGPGAPQAKNLPQKVLF
jgi:hypothetical protein